MAMPNPNDLLHGFLLAGGKFLSVDFPGTTRTTIEGINSRGDFVGAYFDQDGVVFHAYMVTPRSRRCLKTESLLGGIGTWAARAERARVDPSRSSG
jgi:hypothetical protein